MLKFICLKRLFQLKSDTQTNHKDARLNANSIGKYINESTLISKIQIETVLPYAYTKIHTCIEMIIIYFKSISKISPANAFSIFYHFAVKVITCKNS